MSSKKLQKVLLQSNGCCFCNYLLICKYKLLGWSNLHIVYYADYYPHLQYKSHKYFFSLIF